MNDSNKIFEILTSEIKKKSLEKKKAESKKKDDASKKDGTASKKQRDERLLKLLSNFENGYADGWYMFVPSGFKDALDIKMTLRKN